MTLNNPKKSDSNKKVNEKDKKGERKKGGKKKKWEGKVNNGGNEPPIILCQISKGNANSHSTKNCNKKKDFLAFLKEGHTKKQPFKHNRKEINSMVDKKVRKHLKHKFKKITSLTLRTKQTEIAADCPPPTTQARITG